MRLNPHKFNPCRSDMATRNKALIGIAGTHFVAAELSQRGYVAIMTSRNTEGVDILASSLDGSKSVTIQVKTTTGAPFKKKPKRIIGWMLNEKHESVQSENLFYVFVYLKNPNEKPDFYVIPSTVVASHIKARHQEWLGEPGRNGRKHHENSMRVFDMDDDELSGYLNNWDVLALRSAEE